MIGRIAKRDAQIRRAINLAIGGLSDVSVDVGEIVAINGTGPTGDRTCGSLGRIVLVDAHAAFRRYPRMGHFQQIKLRCDLK